MAEKSVTAKKLSDKNTKQEMLDAYQAVVRQLEEQRATELNPQKRIEQKQSAEAIKVAEALSPDGVDREIGQLKADIGKSLAEISDRLAAEVLKFKSIQKAIESKERDLQELYGIERSAASLAALIESQNQKRRDFEIELETQKEQLNAEIETTRADWERERKARETELKEREALEKKAREREKEEFTYAFKREQQSIRDKLNDEKAGLEKEIQRKREIAEKELAEREKAVAEKERELATLQQKTAAFPKELETSVEKAVKESVERVRSDAKNREDLMRKESEGERNVLTTRIESLEKMAKDLAEQNGKLAKQLETAYQKVQDIAEKAIEGSSQAKSLADLQKILAEQNRKSGAEKA
jgi:hypothetical protein